MRHPYTRSVISSAVKSGLALLALIAIVMQPLAAAEAIPEDLDAWSGWVVDDVRDYGCPILYNANTRHCSYPGHLALDLNDPGGTFTQSWSVLRESVVYLPGSREYWPLDVSVNGVSVTVIGDEDRPSITLEKGRHTVSGSFRWQHLPESLAVPVESGLISLRLGGNTVSRPDIRSGQLWLSADKTRTRTVKRAYLKIFRKVIDTVPLQVITRIELGISGEQREISLRGAVPDGFEPVSVESRLPARLDGSGRLSLKVRPGRWVVTIGSRMNREVLALKLGAFPPPWPASELWVFEARPNLRMLKIESPASTDAARSALPDDWKKLPAYLMKAGTSMTFRQIRRGDPQPEPDQLMLERSLWLDFTGSGYTVSDHISGTMSRGWRINAGAGLAPGQVMLDGKPQLITRTADGAVGIEVRQGNIRLAADSRIEDSVRHIPAVGWDHDFSGVSASINMPPGYRVLAISGADRSPTTWLSRWTLLDFFVVLITAIALSKLHGKAWGILGLVGLVALWHEPGAPNYVWLNLIAALSLMRALRDTRAFPLVRGYLILSSLALVLLALPFMVDQVRNAVYPQLAHPWQSLGDQSLRQMPAAAKSPVRKAETATGAITEFAEDRLASPAFREAGGDRGPEAGLDRLVQDPNARLQTGPGLPEWTWRSYPITWNGPVRKDQMLSVYFISPPVNLLFNLFTVGIVVLLAWKLLHEPATGILSRARHVTAAAMIVLVVNAVMSFPGNAVAGYPPQELLQELRKRLLEPADCLPQCAEMEHLGIRLDPELANLSMRVHAAENLALPLPVPLNDWMPDSVVIDNEPATGLFRDSSNVLWVYVEQGVHDISVQGRISHLRNLRLDLPLQLHALEISADGWTADSSDTSPQHLRSLTFTREQVDRSENVFDTQSSIPVFASVTRHLRLGLDWQLVTRVRLESGTALPALLRVPLLDGESVVTDGIKVEDGHVLAGLSEGSRTISWLSTLSQGDSLTLTAPRSQPWSETWSLDVTPIWNVSYSGIPVIYHQQSKGRWNPTWRPWPGEQVTLSVARPRGIEGRTMTIDHSLLTITPGKRATSAELSFTLRSSQGQQHTITLPLDAQLESVSINDTAVPIRQDGANVTLPLKPGVQNIDIKWKEARGIGWMFASPEIDLGSASVNTRIVIKPGYDRWLLLTGGIRQGPAVLFWSVLIVVVLIALALGRIRGTPLKTHSWILLGIGLSTMTPFSALLIAVWILALYARGRIHDLDKASLFNFMQVVLVLLTLVAVVSLFSAVSNGLLGNPDMQVAGNGSTRLQLNWYRDKIGTVMPEVWIISLPVLAYRFLMLAWSMWMAFALINWLKWGWECFSTGRLWRPARKGAARPAGGHGGGVRTDSG
jgi:hypothetical protein